MHMLREKLWDCPVLSNSLKRWYQKQFFILSLANTYYWVPSLYHVVSPELCW